MSGTGHTLIDGRWVVESSASCNCTANGSEQ
jgi:hypothetical protein